MTEYDHRLVRAAYYALCDLVDDEIGRILEYLEESGELENTIIIFHSDHGESLGDHGMYLKGCYFYESNVHVPLIMSWKGHFMEGAVRDELIELIDIAPTILEACGIAPHDGMQGRSFLPLLSGEGEYSPRGDVFSEFAKDKMSGECVAYASMLFDGRYKLCLLHDSAPVYENGPRGELYDLEADPGEHDNLYDAPEYASVKLMMLEKFAHRIAKTADPLPKKSMPW